MSDFIVVPDTGQPPPFVSTQKIQSVPLPDPPTAPARITVVHVLYHQSPERDAKGVESRFTRIISDDGQPYMRETRFEDQWSLLDTGWIKSPGIVVIENRGTHFRVNPTEDEERRARAKSILVGVRPSLFGDTDPTPFAVIPPGESLTLTPASDSTLFVRCAAGSVAGVIHAFPR